MKRIPSLLIVEDEIADALLLKRTILKQWPEVEVNAVHDGGDALDFLEQKDTPREQGGVLPACVLLDLKLRKRDGLEVLKALKSDTATRAIPVIVFTSSSDPSDVKAAYDHHANGYVVKPVGQDELIQTVSAICAYWLGTNHTFRPPDVYIE